jgi:uncharacterized membrane protein YpjA
MELKISSKQTQSRRIQRKVAMAVDGRLTILLIKFSFPRLRVLSVWRTNDSTLAFVCVNWNLQNLIYQITSISQASRLASSFVVFFFCLHMERIDGRRS